MIETLKNIDTSFFLFLNGKHNDFFDVVMWWFSYKYTWVPLYALLLLLIWKKFQKKSFVVLLSVAVLVFLSDQLSVHLFKNVFERYRPCHNLLLKDSVHLVGECGGQFGFVSSHAANTFALAMFLSLIFRKKYFTLLIFLWAAITSYSRIYLGVHYPADVFVGATLGCVIGFFIWQLFVATRENSFFSPQRRKDAKQ